MAIGWSYLHRVSIATCFPVDFNLSFCRFMVQLYLCVRLSLRPGVALWDLASWVSVRNWTWVRHVFSNFTDFKHLPDIQLSAGGLSQNSQMIAIWCYQAETNNKNHAWKSQRIPLVLAVLVLLHFRFHLYIFGIPHQCWRRYLIPICFPTPLGYIPNVRAEYAGEAYASQVLLPAANL